METAVDTDITFLSVGEARQKPMWVGDQILKHHRQNLTIFRLATVTLGWRPYLGRSEINAVPNREMKLQPLHLTGSSTIELTSAVRSSVTSIPTRRRQDELA